ncbi:class I SAM-dependent methyltransferase [Bacillus massilinigeriensis]|uniref:class I SAM-dependent methyltransferase n=1 Tax=Bacillus massilionigeriensis TaxID=1805475 RepID=UPI00096B2BDA|nr:class I SAM-dependent methyltransferase [Bacillus massilionigeriensis]
MFITTAGRTNNRLVEKAKSMANELKIEYVSRRKNSIQAVQQLLNDDCIVVGKDRLEMYPIGGSKPFFFHPNSAMFRVKRIMRGEPDPFLQACNLKSGERFLDCTLGLASDSIVAAYKVGNEGSVVGVEGNPYLAYIVANGLQEWDSNSTGINKAMRSIQVIHQLSTEYLKSLEENSFDCVYFDPMFEDQIIESDGIQGLRRFAVYIDLTEELIQEAKRVSKGRIVLKDHFRSERFKRFGFDVYTRPSAKFHFGVIEK